jgi:hypothetical protein
LSFENWSSGELSKIGHNFSNKEIYKLKLSKNVVLLWYSSIEKDSDDFLQRKSTLKVNFLTYPHYTNSQNSIISFGYADS